MEAGFDTRELEQLARDLEAVADRYPDKAKDFLKKQGNKTRNKLRAKTRAVTTKRTGNLQKGIRRTGVQEHDGDYQIRVYNKAPHAHLIEHGHVQWVPVAGMGRKHQRKTEQFVPGRHPAAHTANEMKTEMGRDAGGLVDEVLREGGFG